MQYCVCCSWDYPACGICMYIYYAVVCLFCGCVTALVYWGSQCTDVQHAVAFCQADVSDVVVNVVTNARFFVIWSKKQDLQEGMMTIRNLGVNPLNLTGWDNPNAKYCLWSG